MWAVLCSLLSLSWEPWKAGGGQKGCGRQQEGRGGRHGPAVQAGTLDSPPVLWHPFPYRPQRHTHSCFGEFLCYFLKLEKPEVGWGGSIPLGDRKDDRASLEDADSASIGDTGLPGPQGSERD